MAPKKSKTFEQALSELETIVQRLEQADVPLEEAMAQFQEGMALSQFCQKKLTEAEQTMTKLMTDNDEEVALS